MAINSSVPEYLDNLKTLLEARPALIDVVVRTGPVGDTRGKSSLEFTEIEQTHNWGALGGRRIDEEYYINGVIWCYARGVDQEEAIKAVRDNAFAIFDEMLQQIRSDPKVNGTVVQSIPESYTLSQGYTSEQRVASLEFRVRVTNHLRAT